MNGTLAFSVVLEEQRAITEALERKRIHNDAMDALFGRKRRQAGALAKVAGAVRSLIGVEAPIAPAAPGLSAQS
jgi:hypothetical protein